MKTNKRPWYHSPGLRKGMAVVLLLICGLGGYWLGTGAHKGPVPNAGLVIEEPCLNIGEVWEKSDFLWPLEITNTTKDEIRIRNFATTCGCLSVKPSSAVLAPGQTTEFVITLDLTGSKPENAHARVREFNVQLVADFEGWPHRAAWRLAGRVKRAVVLQPDVLAFGSELIETRQGSPKGAVITSLIPVEKIVAQCDSEWFTVQVHKRKESPQKYYLEVTPRKGLPDGKIQAHISLWAQTNNQSIELPKLPITGSVQKHIQCTPETIMLGYRRVGETVAETVTLRSLTGKDFAVTKIDVRSADIKVTPIERVPDKKPAYQIEQQITQQGRQENSIVFHIASSRQEKLVLPVTYYGRKGSR